MSYRNDEAAGTVIAFLLVGSVIAAVAGILLILLVIASAVMTVLALLAYHHPLTIGDHTITPKEARTFLWRAVASVLIGPLLMSVFLPSLGMDPNSPLIPYLVVGCYVGGPLLMEALFDKKAPTITAEEPPKIAPSHMVFRRKDPTPPAPTPFEFASWDDDEEKRQ